MNNYKKHIDDFFREKLGRYTETPPADVWDSLDGRLDTLKPVIPGSPGKWIWHAGMVSLIAVLGVSLTQKYIGGSGGASSSAVPTEQIAQVTPAAAGNMNATPATAAASATDVNSPSANATDQQTPTNQNSGSQATGAVSNTVSNTNPATVSGGNSRNGKPVSVNTQYVNGLKNISQGNVYAPTGNGGGYATKGQTTNVFNSQVNEGSAMAEPNQQSNHNDQSVNSATSKAEQTAATKTPEQPANAKKPTTEAIKKTEQVKEEKKKRNPIAFNRWEAGVKGGYERGFDNAASKKFVIAPYIQYNLSSRLSVMAQPAVKFANTDNRNIGTAKSYTNVNNDGAVTQVGNTQIIETTEGTTHITNYYTNYNYRQTHDSVVKSNTYGGSYMQYELPILLKYKLTENLSVYGGVNVVYSQAQKVTEHTYSKKGIVRSVDTLLKTPTLPTPPALGDVITYNGTPYSTYNGPLYPNAQANQIRFGAMLGVSYEYSKRWLVDALIQQNPANKDIRGGADINVPLSATYFRLSVGYKLTK